MSMLIKGIDLPKDNQFYQIEIHPNGHCAVMTLEEDECYSLEIKSETEVMEVKDL